MVSASSMSPFAWTRPSAPIEGAATHGLERGDLIDRGDLRRSRDRPTREDVAASSSVSPTSLRADPRPGYEMLDAGERPLVISSTQRTVPGSQTREGRCARGRRSSRARRRPWPTRASPVSPDGRVPLIGIVRTRRPRRGGRAPARRRRSTSPRPAAAQGSCSKRLKGGGERGQHRRRTARRGAERD